MDLTLTTAIILIISGILVGFINTLAGGGTIISISLFYILRITTYCCQWDKSNTDTVSDNYCSYPLSKEKTYRLE